MLTRLGVLTVGAVVPAIPVAIAQLSALLAPILGQVSQLQTTLALPIVLPDVAGYIAALEAAILNAVEALKNLPAASASLHVGLSAQIALLLALKAAASAVIDTLSASVSAGGLAAYAYEGGAASFGGEAGSAIASDFALTGTVRALVVATADPASWSAFSTIVKTS